jgi:hypothetical protein
MPGLAVINGGNIIVGVMMVWVFRYQHPLSRLHRLHLQLLLFLPPSLIPIFRRQILAKVGHLERGEVESD